MCGIAGMSQTKPSAGEPAIRVEQLVDALRHRGPDDLGVCVRGSAAIAQTRPAIIDVPGGHQPMSNEEERLWIASNGEGSNLRASRHRLSGPHWRTRRDTEVVPHAYEEEGPDCVRKFNGMFAFALLDGDDLVLARDPRGVGSALVFERIAEREISDREFEQEQTLSNGHRLRCKEELYYYRVFRRFYPEVMADCLGWTAAPGRR